MPMGVLCGGLPQAELLEERTMNFNKKLKLFEERLNSLECSQLTMDDMNATIESKVDDAVYNADIDGCVSDALDGKDFSSEIDDALRDYDFYDAIRDALEDYDLSDKVEYCLEDMDVATKEDLENLQGFYVTPKDLECLTDSLNEQIKALQESNKKLTKLVDLLVETKKNELLEELKGAQ